MVLHAHSLRKANKTRTSIYDKNANSTSIIKRFLIIDIFQSKQCATGGSNNQCNEAYAFTLLVQTILQIICLTGMFLQNYIKWFWCRFEVSSRINVMSSSIDNVISIPYNFSHKNAKKSNIFVHFKMEAKVSKKHAFCMLWKKLTLQITFKATPLQNSPLNTFDSCWKTLHITVKSAVYRQLQSGETIFIMHRPQRSSQQQWSTAEARG